MDGHHTHKTNKVAPEIKGILNSALREIMSLTHAECGSLFLFDSEHKELVMKEFYNSQQLNIKGLKYKIGEGISGKVADTQIPILVQDIDSDTRVHRNGFTHYRTKSFISIPVTSAGNLIGLINLTDKSTQEPFTQNDLNVAMAIMAYACLAIENRENYLRLKEEKENSDKQNVLLEKYASVGKLAAGIVHEVNNPLDGIIRYTNMLLNQIDNNSIAREYLLEIKKGLQRIANITRSLLEFSHRVNSISHQEKKYISLHKIIDEALLAFGDKALDTIRVIKKDTDTFPMILDLGLAHIAINIIKNALDAMPNGGALEIKSEIHGHFAEISFKDTGQGIVDDVKNHIFEPFFTTKSIDKGCGLGLAICNEIIKRYEGKIEVQSASGTGSTFTVFIPTHYLKNAQ